MRLQSISERFD